MSERNKQVVRRYVEEVLNRGDLEVLDEIYAPDATFFRPGGQVTQGIDGLKTGLAQSRIAFPDVNSTFEELLAEGDQVAFCVTARGTHSGEWRGMPGTGRQFALTEMQFVRLRESKIVEARILSDRLGMMEQLDQLPTGQR